MGSIASTENALKKLNSISDSDFAYLKQTMLRYLDFAALRETGRSDLVNNSSLNQEVNPDQPINIPDECMPPRLVPVMEDRLVSPLEIESLLASGIPVICASGLNDGSGERLSESHAYVIVQVEKLLKVNGD